MKAMERLYLTADRRALVRQGDPAAATLYAVPGDTIPDSAAERFGLVDGTIKPNAMESGAAVPVKPPKAKAARAAAGKQAPAPANKEAPAGEDKGEA
ncbi:MAG: hypothetical protein ACOY45_15730 [Pseudomonadota bacterium]